MENIKAQYEDLTNKIKQNLPIKALPTRQLVAQIRDKNPNLTLKSEFIIKNVINTGDITGILCTIDCKDTDGLACALTHVIILQSEPLKQEIEKYQKNRAKRVELISNQRMNFNKYK